MAAPEAMYRAHEKPSIKRSGQAGGVAHARALNVTVLAGISQAVSCKGIFEIYSPQAATVVGIRLRPMMQRVIKAWRKIL